MARPVNTDAGTAAVNIRVREAENWLLASANGHPVLCGEETRALVLTGTGGVGVGRQYRVVVLAMAGELELK